MVDSLTSIASGIRKGKINPRFESLLQGFGGTAVLQFDILEDP